MGNTADIGASIIARLKNKSQKERLPLQLLLNLFCQEEILRRIGKSRFSDNLILKGGFLLYSLSGFNINLTKWILFLSNDRNKIIINANDDKIV